MLITTGVTCSSSKKTFFNLAGFQIPARFFINKINRYLLGKKYSNLTYKMKLKYWLLIYEK